MTTLIFVWTFDGIMKAIGAGLLALFLLVLGVAYIVDTIEQRRRKSNRN